MQLRFALALLLLISGSASAATYYVSNSGLDTNAGTLLLPWKTINHAMGIVAPGDTVLVQPGTYTDTYSTISYGIRVFTSGTAGSPITLKSIVRGGAIVDGTGETGREYCFYLDGVSYFTLDGFTVQNCTFGGISLFAASTPVAFGNNTIINNEVLNISNPVNDGQDGHGGQGISEDLNANYDVVCQNYVHDIGNVWDTDFDHGMYMQGNAGTYCNNILYHNRFGAGMQMTSYNPSQANTMNIFNNTSVDNLTNGLVMFTSFGGTFSTVTIDNNIIYGNGQGLVGCSATGGPINANNNISYNNTSNNFNSYYCG
jgi:hypothetical protein